MSDYVYLQPWMIDRVVTIRTKDSSTTGKLSGYIKRPHVESISVWFTSRDYAWQFMAEEIVGITVEDNS